MSTYFISDLHLDDDRPESTACLLEFLAGRARDADALFILGDLFEVWIGDDERSALTDRVAEALSALAAAGVPVAFMRGNRDFLLGHDYAARCGMRLLPDAAVIDLYGEPVLLLHGDTLCTDDAGYQAFRRQVRDPQWQAGFLAQPLTARRQFAAQARAASAVHQAQTGMLGDVSDETVRSTFALYGVERMIHGHTHRPCDHRLTVGERTCERRVLADWHPRGEALEVHPDRSHSRLRL